MPLIVRFCSYSVISLLRVVLKRAVVGVSVLTTLGSNHLLSVNRVSLKEQLRITTLSATSHLQLLL